jgi:hypothetical protein
MNLEDLVPPLELCEKIPAGEFADSALVWLNIQYTTIPWKVVERRISRYKMERNKKSFPAPTLQEILAALPPYAKNEQVLACCVPDWADFDARVFGEHWRVGYTGDCSINDKKPATAALKLWLKLKGIEDGLSDLSETSDLSDQAESEGKDE